MRNLYNDAITAVYHHGSKITLNATWHDKNIVCPNSKIYYVLSGEICVETDNSSYIARRGDAILIPAGVKHSYHLTDIGEAEKYWFHFDLRAGQYNYFESIDFPYLKNIGYNKSICELFETVINCPSDTPSGRLAVSSSLMSIIGIFLDGSKYIKNDSVENDETDTVIDFIKKNYNEKFTLKQLADMAKLSPNHFAKKFKERIGHPPIKYINALKLERAKFLLEYTAKPINKVMEEVGFLDAAHFSKLFKLETGYSPSKFRRALVSKTFF